MFICIYIYIYSRISYICIILDILVLHRTLHSYLDISVYKYTCINCNLYDYTCMLWKCAWRKHILQSTLNLRIPGNFHLPQNSVTFQSLFVMTLDCPATIALIVAAKAFHARHRWTIHTLRTSHRTRALPKATTNWNTARRRVRQSLWRGFTSTSQDQRQNRWGWGVVCAPTRLGHRPKSCAALRRE